MFSPSLATRLSVLSFFGVVGAFLLTSTGCNKKEVQLTPTKPVEVVVASAVTREVTDFEDFTGRLEAIHRIDIKAQVKGYLKKIHFKEGDEVKKGDLLFEIDPTVFQAELEYADSLVKQTNEKSKRLKREYERAKVLRAENSMSLQDFEKAMGSFNEAAAAEKVAEATRVKADINLKYTKVYAEPVGGVTSRAMIDPGNFVEAEKTLLTTIVASHTIYAYFDVDERTTLARTRRGISEGKTRAIEPDSKVLLALSDEKDFEHIGVIDFIDNAVNPGTGTKRMRAVFENPKRLLSPGLFVRIRYPLGTRPSAIVIPDVAIGTDQGQKFVYIVDKDNEVVYRRVRTGPQIKTYRVVEDAKYKQKEDGTLELDADGKKIILEGLESGERVITSGLQRVRPRTKVDPRPMEVPPDAGVSHLNTLLKSHLLRDRPAAPVKGGGAAP